MNSKKLFLTSSGLSADMKKKFFDIIGKCPEDVKVLYIPTAGIETDGAREGFAVCFQELSSMGIRYENILVYNLELILSKDYQRTYSTCVTDPYMLTRLLTIEELQSFDAVAVSYTHLTLSLKESLLFKDIETNTVCWMSHTDQIENLPNGFHSIAHTDSCPVAAMECRERNLYGEMCIRDRVRTALYAPQPAYIGLAFLK